MSEFKNKVDFAIVFSVKGANPNGDPLNGNRPRVNYDGLGEVSDVCIKRKIRNRWQDSGKAVFIQSEDRADDGCKSLQERADSYKEFKEACKNKDSEKAKKLACKKWIDVRAFGQLFAFKKKNANDEDTGKSGISIGIRGPVSIQSAFSLDPVEVETIQITKSVNSDPNEKKGSDTMGLKHRIDHATYVCYGSINCQLAEKTGFSKEDADSLQDALRTLFENDCSSARPDGSMEVNQVYWWEHDSKSGKYPSARVFRSLHITRKVENPSCYEDYGFAADKLEGVTLHLLVKD